MLHGRQSAKVSQVRCECGLTVVGHHVHTAGGENGRLAGSQGCHDRVSSVLFLHPSCGVAQYSYDPVGGARMVVWWQHGAWAEIDRGYCWVVSTSCLVQYDHGAPTNR